MNHFLVNLFKCTIFVSVLVIAGGSLLIVASACPVGVIPLVILYLAIGKTAAERYINAK